MYVRADQDVNMSNLGPAERSYRTLWDVSAGGVPIGTIFADISASYRGGYTLDLLDYCIQRTRDAIRSINEIEHRVA